MTARFTVAGARFFQQQLFGKAAEPLETYWLALVRQSSPTIFNTGDELDEIVVSDSGYSRQAIGNNAGQWRENLNLSRTNAEDIIFGPALTEWGTLKYWALCSDSSGGDTLAFGTLSSPVDVNALDRVVIPSGSLALNVNVLFQGH